MLFIKRKSNHKQGNIALTLASYYIGTDIILWLINRGFGIDQLPVIFLKLAIYALVTLGIGLIEERFGLDYFTTFYQLKTSQEISAFYAENKQKLQRDPQDPEQKAFLRRNKISNIALLLVTVLSLWAMFQVVWFSVRLLLF